MGSLDLAWWESRLFYLLCGHALMDYALQSEQMAELKHPHAGTHNDYGPWWWHMTAHSLLNGLWVGYVCHWWVLGLAETVVHFSLDTMKCLGKIDTNQDQVGHLLSKFLWVSLG